MQTILMATFGSAGDINPFIAVGRALAARGARPVLIVNAAVAGQVAAAGLAARSLGDPMEIPDVLRRRPQYMSVRGPALVLRELFIPLIPLLCEETRRAIAEERPSVVVSHPLCPGSAWAAARAGVPAAVIHLSPTSLFSRRDLSFHPRPLRLLYRAVFPLLSRLADGLLRPACGTSGSRGWFRGCGRGGAR